MKIEPSSNAAASLFTESAERDASYEPANADAFASSEPMTYEALLPFLLLPMAGAY